ncbi:MAG: archaeosortase/exosortase family protein [Bacteroidales bacterium]|nr:archaeosortase/exosortase family protein [Bacteroidales bacterium]
MKFLIDKYKNLTPLIKFFANGVILVIIWSLFYQFLRYSPFINSFYEVITNQLTKILLISSKFLLEIFGFETEISGKTMRIFGTEGVYLDRGCLARNLMGLFAGFIIAFPGNIKYKLWVIPAGLLVINILNVFRISGLAYLVLRYPEYVDINHHVIFKYTVYFFIFLLWYFWIKYYSASAKKKTSHEKVNQVSKS